jgi:hypothetical protein
VLATLAFRHLLVRRGRALFLLFGFSLGVGVMIVLLSVGEAMLAQSRDTALVGGGEVTVLPEGIDVEAMRTGGLSGLFFGIDRARYVGRQLLGGPRQRGVVRAVAPAIEAKLLYLSHGGRTISVRAGGEVPSRSVAVGAGLHVVSGTWADSRSDSTWIAPSAQQLYDELDRFHIPAVPDTTWGEWHYFNVVTGPGEWWYVTLLIGGEVPHGRWGGQLLVTRRRPDGRYERFTDSVSPERIAFDTAGADLTLGESSVRQRNGAYSVAVRGPGGLRLDFTLVPAPNRHFPPVELRADEFVSGYVVPALAATASGRFCAGARCTDVADVAAYHDHNWGVWRDVTWEWGAATGGTFSLLYGGVRTEGEAVGGAPFFLALVDSAGMRQVLRFNAIAYEGRQLAREGDASAPERFALVAARGGDTVRLDVGVTEALASRARTEGFSRYFLQMSGHFTLSGRIAGAAVADSGTGFFETYVPGAP